jgi:hypothetical protein
VGREYAEVGGLMSYRGDVADAFREAGIYAGRILKGAKPSELPVVHRIRSSWSSTTKLLGCSASSRPTR